MQNQSVLKGWNPFSTQNAEGRFELDFHLLAFFFNVFLVLMSYFWMVTYGNITVLKTLRIALIALSVVALLIRPSKAKFGVSQIGGYIFGGFLLLNLCVLPFALVPDFAMSRFLTMVPFLVYLFLFARHIKATYSAREGLLRVILVCGYAYLFPVAMFFYSGGAGQSNIYGQHSDGFYSNQFGWASAIVVTCMLDALGNIGGRSWLMRGIALAGLFGALYLALISGARSSYLSIACTFATLIIFNRSVGLPVKAVLVGLAIGSVAYLLLDQNSAINQRAMKTQTQIKKGEGRLVSARMALEAFTEKESLYLTGLGFDSFIEGVYEVTKKEPEEVHNSYLEVFFDSGAIVFLWLILGIVLPSLFQFYRFHSGSFTFLPTFLIIPYFESNYGAGQFLFFPWMFILMYYTNYLGSGGDAPVELVAIPAPEVEASVS